MSEWKSRIVGSAEVDPNQLTGHPQNHRTHPMAQREVVKDSIAEFGFVKSVLVNRTTGFIVDGHARVWAALDEIQKLEREGKDTTHVIVPVEYVELSESEEKAVLAILDASTEMAVVDPVKLDALLQEVNTGSQAIADMLTELAEESGALAVSIEGCAADLSTEWEDSGMPDYDGEPEGAGTVIVHFKDQGSRKEFSDRIGVKFGDQSKFIWFPERP